MTTTDAPALTALPHLTRIGEVLEGLTRDIQDQAARATLPATRTELIRDRLALTSQYLDYVRLVQQQRFADTGPDVLTARVGKALGFLTEADGGNHGPYLTTTCRAMFTIPATSLRHLRADRPTGEEAGLALMVLVAGINEILAPVVRALDSGAR